MRRAMPRLSCVARALFAAFALHFLHGGLEHRRVELEADSFDVAALFAAEHVPCPAQFEIERGDFESCAEIAEFLERGETAAGNVGQFSLGRNEQVGSMRGDWSGPRGREAGRVR